MPGRCQGGAREVPGRCQGGAREVPGRCQGGAREVLAGHFTLIAVDSARVPYGTAVPVCWGRGVDDCSDGALVHIAKKRERCVRACVRACRSSGTI